MNAEPVVPAWETIFISFTHLQLVNELTAKAFFQLFVEGAALECFSCKGLNWTWAKIILE